jgi:two-component system nitrate/nitrite response regulator NarL
VLVSVACRPYDSRVANRSGTVRILIVDHHRLLAESLHRAIERERGVRVVGIAATPEQAETLASQASPEVALVDLDMPGESGLDAIRAVRRTAPEARVVALIAERSDVILGRAVEAGAVGYITTFDPLDRVREAIVRAGRGEPLLPAEESVRLLRHLRRRRAERASAGQRADRLTRRELQILQAMAEGADSRQVASTLAMSPATFRTHMQNILTKLGVRSRAEALAFAIRHGKVSARH